jgi:predicted nucleic acid-binding Zn ribbon protein
MAIYEYEILNADGTARAVFEVEQTMSEPALTRHPETGEPLRRILSSTFAHGSRNSSGCTTGSCGLPPSLGSGGCAGGSCGWG